MSARKVISRKDLMGRRNLHRLHFECLEGPGVEYIGEGDLAPFMLAELVKAGVNVVSFLTTSKPPINIPKVDVRVVSKKDLPEKIGERGDYSVIGFYGKKIPADTISRLNGDSHLPYDGRLFNLHPSLLPEFQGWADPVREMIEQGRRHLGVSMHYVSAHLDGGPVVGQRYYFLPLSCCTEKRDSVRGIIPKTEKAYILHTVPAMAALCYDVINHVDDLETINQHHETLIPEQSFLSEDE